VKCEKSEQSFKWNELLSRHQGIRYLAKVFLLCVFFPVFKAFITSFLCGFPGVQ